MWFADCSCVCECVHAYFPTLLLALSHSLSSTQFFNTCRIYGSKKLGGWRSAWYEAREQRQPYLELRIFTCNLLPHCNKVLSGFVHNLHQFRDFVRLPRYSLWTLVRCEGGYLQRRVCVCVRTCAMNTGRRVRNIFFRKDFWHVGLVDMF